MARKPVQIQSLAVADFALLLGTLNLMEQAEQAHQQAQAWEQRARCIEQAAVTFLATNLPH